MKNQELEKIAKLTGSSKATVSKALNHCFGVERERREKILAAARNEGIGRDGKCAIYGIFPDRPMAFWGQVMKELHPLYEEFPCKFNICPHGSSTVLAGYLEEAIRLDAALLLIGGYLDCEILQKMAAETPIFFLFGQSKLVNTFSFSENACEEGAALRKCLPINDEARILILQDGRAVTQERIRGFLSDHRSPVYKLSIENERETAAHLARSIAAAEIPMPDVIYAATGSLREAALAACKLGMRMTVVAGHDCDGAGELCGVRYVGVMPNVKKICQTALDAAREYCSERRFPAQKVIRVGRISDFTIN